MYRDYEEYMRTVLGYNPIQEGMNRNTYINPFVSNTQFNNMNSINQQMNTPETKTTNRSQPIAPLNTTSVRQMADSDNKINTPTESQNNTQNRNAIEQTHTKPQNNSNNRISKERSNNRNIDKNTPATSYKNFLKF